MTNPAAIKYENNRLKISGDLNFKSMMQVWQQSLPMIEKNSHLDFDFAEVIATKSAGLILMLEWVRMARKNKKIIKFYNIPAHLLVIAKVCGVDNIVVPVEAGA